MLLELLPLLLPFTDVGVVVRLQNMSLKDELLGSVGRTIRENVGHC